MRPHIRMAFLFASLAVCSYVAWRIMVPRTAVQQTPPAPRVAPLAEMPRPHPDARAMLAIGDIHRIVTGSPRHDVVSSFVNGRWHLTCAGTDVGTLSESPDYPELRGLLASWATRLGARRVFAAAPSSGATPAVRDRNLRILDRLQKLEALPALGLLDREWATGRRDLDLVAMAAHGYALLQLEAVDRVGASDTLAARALSFVAIAAACDPDQVIHDECILADRLGYSAAACALAGRLPDDDPAKWFVLRTLGRLVPLAGSGTPEARLMRLVSLASRGDLETWSTLAGRESRDHPSLALPVLSTGLLLGRFESRMAIGTSMIAAVAAELKLMDGLDPATVPGETSTYGQLDDAFERLLRAMPATADGVVMDRSVVGSYYRSCYYSGLKALADHLLYAYSSAPDAEALAQETRAQSGAAEEFGRWFADVAAAKAGRDNGTDLERDLRSLPHFGEPLLALTLMHLRDLAARTGGHLPEPAARALAERLDTRPDHLQPYSWMLVSVMRDPCRAEVVDSCLAVTRAAADSWWVRYAAYRGDAARLLELAQNRELPLGERAQALRALTENHLGDTTTVADAHAKLAAEYPDEFVAVDELASHLESRGRLAEARGVLSAWLRRPSRSDRAFEEVVARTDIARLDQACGNPAAGLEAIRPVVSSWKFSALERTALLLEDLGRTGDADSLAMAAWRRYPDNRRAQALVVGLFVRHGNDSLAARALAIRGSLLDAEAIRELLVPSARRRFDRDPDRLAGLVATATTTDPATIQSLRVLSAELNRAGDDRLAFELESRIPSRGDESFQIVLTSYRYLERWQGPLVATRWLSERTQGLNDEPLERLLTLAFGQGEDRLLWDLPWPQSTGEFAEYMWLLRAAAAVRSPGEVSPEGRQAVEAHFSRPGASHYRMLGRYLLGHEQPSAVLSTATTPRAMSEVYYYFGFKAQCATNVREAARWYSRCIALHQRANAEDFWANVQLADWIARGISLDRIAEEARRTPARARASA